MNSEKQPFKTPLCQNIAVVPLLFCFLVVSLMLFSVSARVQGEPHGAADQEYDFLPDFEGEPTIEETNTNQDQANEQEEFERNSLEPEHADQSDEDLFFEHSEDDQTKEDTGNRGADEAYENAAIEQESEDWLEKESPYSLSRRPQEPRNFLLPPLLSLFVPGLDQWYEGQYGWAAFYTGGAIASLTLGGFYGSAFLEGKTSDDVNREVVDRGLYSEDRNLRRSNLAFQTVQALGGMSAFHSFRSAVRTRPEDFSFIETEETPQDVYLAPFDFSYVSRPTTFIPLGVIAAVSLWQINGGLDGLDNENGYILEKRSMTSEDVMIGGGISFNAGTSEEAFFRGYLLPTLHHYTGNAHMARIGDAALFGLAHMASVDVPVFQTLLGYYLGWLTQGSGYSIGEAVFIHTWWDIFSFIGTFHYRLTQKPESKVANLPVVWTPKLQWTF